MKFILTISFLLFSIPNLMTLEPDLFSNANFTLNEKSTNFFEYNGEVYVVGDDGTHGVELMKIDTLGNKLELVIDINKDGDSNPFILTKLGEKFIFKTKNDNQSPTNFWSSDGTESGTTLLFEVESSYSNEHLVSSLIVRNNELFLQLPGEGFGDNLWVTDGTAENSSKITKSIEEIQILTMTIVNNRIIFLGDNGNFENNYALWSIGDSNKPLELGDYDLKRGYDRWFRRTNELLFFTTYNEENEESTDLWATDGTKNGIVNVATFDSEHEIDLSYRENHFVLNNKLFFSSKGKDNNINGIWVSNGTTEGTFDLKEIGIETDKINYFEFEGQVNDRLLISIIDNVNFNTTLWSTDGETNGTYNLTDISAGRIRSWNKKEIDGYLYFSHGLPNDHSLWKTNGTPGSATKIIDIPKNQHSDSYWSILYEYDNKNKIYFASIFEKNVDLYSFDVKTEELDLLHSSREGGVSDMRFIDNVAYMLYSTKDKRTMHYNFSGMREEIIPEKFSNKKPFGYDLDLQKSGDYIYFFADYEGDETYQLYRFENPSSGISSVEDYDSNQINFYPNPTSNNLTLDLEEMTDISIVDINGNQILSFSDFTGGVIDLSSLTAGFYSIININGTLLGKFIKAE